MRPPDCEAGFTLIELLVALAVFSLAVMALLNLASENLAAGRAAEIKVLASVVAENRAVEALTSPAPPGLGTASGVEPSADRSWRWTRRVTATAEPGLLRVDVLVRDPESGRTAAELTVFRALAR